MDKTQMVRKGKAAGITGSICRELLTSEIRPKGFVAPFKFYVTLTIFHRISLTLYEMCIAGVLWTREWVMF